MLHGALSIHRRDHGCELRASKTAPSVLRTRPKLLKPILVLTLRERCEVFSRGEGERGVAGERAEGEARAGGGMQHAVEEGLLSI